MTPTRCAHCGLVHYSVLCNLCGTHTPTYAAFIAYTKGKS